MCGFTGIWFSDKEKKVSKNLLEKMTSAIAHRGPDASGYHVDGNMGMGFRRLSIIDLEGGQQPMCDATGRAWVTFNGEIYNYKQIREQLLQKGYTFNTHSDTEVLLNAYLEYGNNCVDHLRGMFAFAIYDVRACKLVLGRDRFGIKPLHYLLSNTTLVFGSELKSIVESGYSKKQIDPSAVDSYFSYGYILSPLSIYKDVKKLQAGSLLVITLNNQQCFNSQLIRYWRPTFKPDFKIGYEDYKERLKDKLQETVRMHLVSDVPVGAFLSGGIDSNAVVSSMIKMVPHPIQTFSIGFGNKGFDEAVLAKKSAAIYGTQHTELYLEPGSANLLDKIVEMYDEPFGDSSVIPTYFVSKMAAQSVKVVLSGDGGDEFFGGYKDYQRLLTINKYRHFLKIGSPAFKLLSRNMPKNMKGKRFLYSLSHNPAQVHALTMEINSQEKKDFFSRDFYNQDFTTAASIKLNHLQSSLSGDFISKQMELDILTYMTDDILTKVDRASMANSLEVRVPLIDHEFFELAASIPSSMKISGQTGKYILREAVKNQIPDFIYNKPKTGFTVPITKWFKDDLSDYVMASLEDAKSTGIINDDYIDELLKTKNIGSLVTRIWPIIIFSAWHRKNLS